MRINQKGSKAERKAKSLAMPAMSASMLVWNDDCGYLFSHDCGKLSRTIPAPTASASCQAE